MRPSAHFAALCCGLVAIAGVVGPAAADSDHGKRDGTPALFSVPFFIENALAQAPGALRADFKLAHPAVLESYSVSCAGAPRGGLLLLDGGPLGTNGTTGAGADSQVGLVVGLFSSLLAPLQVDFQVATNGAYYVPPTRVGVPVNANYSFIVFPNAPAGVQCNGLFVFRSID